MRRRTQYRLTSINIINLLGTQAQFCKNDLACEKISDSFFVFGSTETIDFNRSSFHRVLDLNLRVRLCSKNTLPRKRRQQNFAIALGYQNATVQTKVTVINSQLNSALSV